MWSGKKKKTYLEAEYRLEAATPSLCEKTQVLHQVLSSKEKIQSLAEGKLAFYRQKTHDFQIVSGSPIQDSQKRRRQ